MLKKMKIGQRLTFYFITVSLVSSIAGFVGITILHKNNMLYSEVITEHNSMQIPLYGIYKDILVSRIYLRDYIMDVKITDKEILKTKIDALDNRFSINFNALKHLLKTEAEQKTLFKLKNLLESYRNVTNKLILNPQNSDISENASAEEFMRDKGTPLAVELIATIEQLIQLHHEDVDSISLKLDAQVQRTIAFMFSLVIISFGLAAIISIFATRSINIPLLRLKDAALKVANKDTSFELAGNSYDEIGIISEVLNTSVKKTFHELHERNQTIMQSLAYAQQIQNSILPTESLFKATFSDYQIIWKPFDKVGGDFYWMSTFDKGTLLFVGDCTGHGAPGAMLTMLCASILKSVVNQDNCHDLQNIIKICDQQFAGIINRTTQPNPLKIHDHLDFGIFFIEKSGRLHFAAKGMRLHISDGRAVRVIKGTRMSRNFPDFVGAAGIAVHTIEHDAQNRFYISTDGLFDQIGSKNNLPFGYATFKDIILTNHADSLTDVTENIWKTFLCHMGNEPRRDDITLIAFAI